MLNPICEVRVDEVIDKRKTHRGVAIAILVYHKKPTTHVMFLLMNFLQNSYQTF